eukprot:bmy_02160T0
MVESVMWQDVIKEKHDVEVYLGTKQSRVCPPNGERSLMDEHNDVQKKTFTKWINARFSKSGKPPISDMFTDLKDGRKLLDLLEGLTGTSLPKERGSTRVHALNNVNRVLQVLHQNNCCPNELEQKPGFP